MSEQPAIRTCDTVFHRPSGERWLVAYVWEDHLAWCGWPEGEARLEDCDLVKSCSDEKHWALVEEIAHSASGARARHCQRMLEQRTQEAI